MGYLDVVDRLREMKGEVNEYPADDDGRTRLQAAAESGPLEVMDQLLEHKADIIAKGIASGSGPIKEVSYYLDEQRRSSVSLPLPGISRHGKTALHAAASRGHLPVVDRQTT